MKTIFTVLTALTLTLIFSAYSVQAMELHGYKASGSSIMKLNDAEVDKVFSAGNGSPACLKDGSKIIGVNKAFTARRLGYRDCSTSDAARAKQQGLGYEVTVIKLEQLSPAKMKQALKVN